MCTLTASAAADEAHVGERGDAGEHVGDAVAQLAAVVLVVAGRHRDPRAVAHVSAQRHDAERRRQRLVGAPVSRQSRAREVRTVRPDQPVCAVKRAQNKHTTIRKRRTIYSSGGSTPEAGGREGAQAPKSCPYRPQI